MRLAYQRALCLPTQLLGLLALGFLELLLLVDEPRDLSVFLLDLIQLLLVDGGAALQTSPTTNITSTPRRRAITITNVTASLAEKHQLKTAVCSTPYTTFRMRQHVVIHQREIYINAIANIKTNLFAIQKYEECDSMKAVNSAGQTHVHSDNNIPPNF